MPLILPQVPTGEVFIQTHDIFHMIGLNQIGNLFSFGSVAWPVANRAYYIPLRMDRKGVLSRLFLHNGSTAAGNFDIGLYSSSSQGPQDKLISTGSTAQAGTQVPQSVDMSSSNFCILPGLYYLALAMSSTSGTVVGHSPNPAQARYAGILQQNTALALPSSATPAAVQNGIFPTIGLTFRAII
jgi:hypothetical protein